MEVIRTENLAKSFGNQVAVDEISIRVNEGEIYGFLGLNGAGKTTTIRILLGMIRPDKGTVSLFGKKAQLNVVSYSLQAIICLSGYAAAQGWWRYADQTK